MGERKGFSFEKFVVMIAVVVIVYFAAVQIFSDARDLFNRFVAKEEISVSVDQQGAILLDEMRYGKVMEINNDGFTIKTDDGDTEIVRYDKKNQCINMGENIQVPGIIAAKFLYIDRTGEQTSEPQDVREVKIKYTIMINPMSGIIEKHSLIIPMRQLD